MKYVLENGFITKKEAKELLSLAVSTTKRILREMSEEGLLTAEGEYKARKYVLNSPPHSVKM